jgi:hypothetical protein
LLHTDRWENLVGKERMMENLQEGIRNQMECILFLGRASQGRLDCKQNRTNIEH